MWEAIESIVMKLVVSNPVALLCGILLFVLIGAVYVLWSAHQKQQMQHRDEYKGIVKEMFEVIQLNTEANTQLKDSIRELSINIRK